MPEEPEELEAFEEPAQLVIKAVVTHRSSTNGMARSAVLTKRCRRLKARVKKPGTPSAKAHVVSLEAPPSEWGSERRATPPV